MLRHWFIVPDLNGPVTGGTRYNRELFSALTGLGVPCVACDFEAGAQALTAGAEGLYWVDTLYLPGFAKLLAENRAARRLGLLCHYLPSLVRGGGAGLDEHERLAIAQASLFLAPSPYMKAALESYGAPGRAVLVAEPGRPGAPIPLPAETVRRSGRAPLVNPTGLRAVLVANLVEGKGVEPFLGALTALARSRDHFELTIVGSLDADRDYARACQRLVERDGRVTFTGPLTPNDVLHRMSEATLVVSASRMESYGMALAEARSLGIPILAREGGNVGTFVHAASGGELVADETLLAHSFLRLSRDRAELSARTERARSAALPPRSWARTAEDLLAQLRACDP